MLDVKFIRENLELVKKSAKEKGYKIKVEEVLELDDRRKKELAKVEELRRRRNEIAAKMKGGKPEPELIKEGKEVKEETKKVEKKVGPVKQETKKPVKKEEKKTDKKNDTGMSFADKLKMFNNSSKKK